MADAAAVDTKTEPAPDAVVKDLAYYETHLNEMPTDPKSLERLMNEANAGTDDKGAPAPSATPDTQKAEATPNADEPKGVLTEEPKGVFAKDGEHVIPYDVLRTTRSRLEGADRLIAEQTALIATLQAQLTSNGQPIPAASNTNQTDDPIADIRDELPTLAKVFDAQAETIRALQEQVQRVTARDAHQQQEAQRTAEELVRDALDKNPTLLDWEANNVDLWNEAAELDALLRNKPENANLTFDQRFEKVVNAMVAIHGDSILPDTKPTQQQIRQKAEDIVKAAGTTAPVTLSDIPGGTAPATREVDNIDQMSPSQLANKMRDMSADQLQEYLARVG